MLTILCPSCSAAYQIKPEKIGPQGRKLKCAKCGHVWVAMVSVAAEPEAASVDVPEAGGPGPALAAAPMRGAAVAEGAKGSEVAGVAKVAGVAPISPPTVAETIEEPPIGPEEEPAPVSLDLIARPRWKMYFEAEQKWLTFAFFLAALGLVGAAVGVAIQMGYGLPWGGGATPGEEAALPAAEGAAKAVSEVVVPVGVVVHGVTATVVNDGANQILTVRGNVANISNQTTKLPLLRVELLTGSGKVADFWNPTLVTTTLPAQAEIPFAVSFTNPVGQAYRVQWFK